MTIIQTDSRLLETAVHAAGVGYKIRAPIIYTGEFVLRRIAGLVKNHRWSGPFLRTLRRRCKN